MEILHKGETVLIDSPDLDLWQSFSWNFNKQHENKLRVVNNKRQYLHRLIGARMGFDMSKQVDHINGNPLDNRRSNLRPATNQQNNCNRGTQKNNTSGHKGVSWRQDAQKWRSRIKVNGSMVSLGYFVKFDDAVAAYREAAIKYHGDFVRFD